MDRKWNVLAVAVAIAGWLVLGAMPALAAVQCVNGGNPMCFNPSPPFCDGNNTTIQAAVTVASAGDTVCVGAGIYDEQVTIDKALTLQGAGMALTSIKPSGVVFNTSNIVSGAQIAAIVFVKDATGVAVMDLTVDGSNQFCSTGFVGIFYRASSGAIEDTRVTGMSPGCDKALGIFVQTDKGGKTKADVAILNNEVDMYGKNGITANQAGTFVTVNGNKVTGDSMFDAITDLCLPPKSDTVQNGVQIGFGARGIVTGNTAIADHCYTPADFVACGVLFFKAGGGPGRAQENTFAGNEGNVCNASGAIGSAHSPFNP